MTRTAEPTYADKLPQTSTSRDVMDANGPMLPLSFNQILEFIPLYALPSLGGKNVQNPRGVDLVRGIRQLNTQHERKTIVTISSKNEIF